MYNWPQLESFLGDNRSSYFNKWNVLFNRVDANIVMVDAVWPGHTTTYDISIVYLSQDETQFFSDLHIKKAAAIEEITPDNLLQLYFQGKAIVVCAIDNESLEFEVRNEKIYAKNGDSDLIHLVEKQLTSPDDYILYTRNYFLSLNNGIGGDWN